MRNAGFSVLLALAAVACGGGDLDGTVGALGEGVFRYECVADGDARCNVTMTVDTMAVGADLGIDKELPVAVAVGARFDLTYLGDFTTDQGESLILDTVSARDDIVTDSGGFVIEQPGRYAFLARSPKGYVADFVHLDAERATELDVWHDESKTNAVELTEGTETTMAVVASSRFALAGAIAYEWESSDPTIVGVDSIDTAGPPQSGVEINDDEVRVVGLAAGTATLTVSAGELTHEIAVTVTAAPPEENP